MKFSAQYEKSKKLNIGAFMTEFGALFNDTYSIQEFNQVLEIVEDKF